MRQKPTSGKKCYRKRESYHKIWRNQKYYVFLQRFLNHFYPKTVMINDNIVRDLVNKRESIIPVIGDDAIEALYQGKKLTFQQFLLQRFKDAHPSIINSLTPDILDKIEKDGYYGQSLLEHCLKEDKHYDMDYYCDEYIDFVTEAIRKKQLRLKQSVRDFLQSFEFPLVITTMCFNLIEEELKDGDKKKSNIIYQSLWYEGKDIEFGECCIFHVFGKAEDNKEWVHNETGLLKCLHRINNERTAPITLMELIKQKKKRLLVLGCNLPNWLFRFLWYPMQGDHKELESKQGYWINKDKPNNDFGTFLNDIQYLSEQEMDELLVLASTKMNELKKEEEKEIKTKVEGDEQYDIFLSYASEDHNVVQQIYNILKDKLKVWYDARGDGEIQLGDPYWENIRKGIEASQHYMPIITSSFLRKMTESSNLKKEYEIVRQWFAENSLVLPQNYSIPVVVANEKYNDNPINSGLVEQWGNIGVLDKRLFDGRKMADFNPKHTQEFEGQNWEIFKHGNK